MNMKRILTIVVAVLTMTTVLTFSDYAEGDDNLDGKTKDTAITRNITLHLNETKLMYFNSNLCNFEFVNDGDGYIYTIVQTAEEGKIQHILQKSNGTFKDTWPSNGIKEVEAEGVNIIIAKNGQDGCLSLAVTLKSDTGAYFYLRYTVISYGITQTFFYKVNIAYESVEEYTFQFSSVNMDYEGLFSASGKMLASNEEDVSARFKFYAIGLYSGVSIHNDLTVTGVVDDSDTRWLNTTTMPFTIIATNLNDQKVYVGSASINFTYDRTYETNIDFTLKEGAKTLLTEASTNMSVNVMENADLTLTVESGTSAWVVFKGDSGVQKEYLWSPANGSSASPIITNGAGRYDVTLKQLDGSEATFSVNVIATFVPVNKIYVTCSSV